MPLYVTNGKLQLGEPGQLAAQRACCCNEEGDNPEDCVCPEFCIFQIQIVSPVVSRIYPPSSCSGEEFLQDYLPCTEEQVINSGNFCQQILNFDELTSSYIRVSYIGHLHPRAGVTAAVSFYCGEGNRLYLEVWRQVNAFWLSGGGGYIQQYQAATFEIAGDCERVGNKTCALEDFPSRRAVYPTAMPIEFSFNSEGTSLGPWQTDETEIVGDPSLAEADIDPPFVFRITQRQSCRIVDCNCSTSLDGLKATFEGKEFTLGTESSYSEFFDDYELVTAHYMDFSGNYVFEKYQVMAVPAGAIGDVQMVVIYCETDNQADPPVSRWYARYESICRKYEAGGTGVVLEETKKTEIGYLPCSESAGCAGRTENDPVPLGSPIDVEEIEGSPETTDGTAACTPPARANINIFEDCG